MTPEQTPYQGRIVYLEVSPETWRPAIVVATCCLEPLSESDLIVFCDGSYDDNIIQPEAAVQRLPGDLYGFAERRIAGKGVGFFRLAPPPLKAKDKA